VKNTDFTVGSSSAAKRICFKKLASLFVRVYFILEEVFSSSQQFTQTSEKSYTWLSFAVSVVRSLASGEAVEIVAFS